MKVDETRYQALKRTFPDAQVVDGEGGFYIHLPSLKAKIDGTEKATPALLRPWANGDGYPTRLFFAERISNKGSNWNVFSIAGRTWHACSWSGVEADLPWLDMIASHFRPLL